MNKMDKKTSAELSGKAYSDIINPEYKWEVWAVPKDLDRKLGKTNPLKENDLTEFVELQKT